jgi:hypothetical protein
VSRKDPVSDKVAEAVARRDFYQCVAPRLDQVGWCHDKWGNLITRWPDRRIDADKVTFAHVKEADEQAMGSRAKSDTDHLLLLCWGHHLGSGERGGYCWGTSRPGLEKQRGYLAQFQTRTVSR